MKLLNANITSAKSIRRVCSAIFGSQHIQPLRGSKQASFEIHLPNESINVFFLDQDAFSSFYEAKGFLDKELPDEPIVMANRVVTIPFFISLSDDTFSEYFGMDLFKEHVENKFHIVSTIESGFYENNPHRSKILLDMCPHGIELFMTFFNNKSKLWFGPKDHNLYDKNFTAIKKSLHQNSLYTALTEGLVYYMDFEKPDLSPLLEGA